MGAAERALEAMPREIYGRSAIVAALVESVGPEFDDLRSTIEEIGASTSVTNAPTWALELMEAEAGIPRLPDSSEADRRARLRAAGWRASGTATPARIRALAAAWEFGSVSIEEDFANYRVTLTFDDIHGEPADLSALQRAMRRVIPANLEIVYQFTWYTWRMLREAGLTWAELRATETPWVVLGVDGPNAIEEEDMPLHFTKTITFDGSPGAGQVGTDVVLAVASGMVLAQSMTVKCTDDLVSSGGTIEVFTELVAGGAPSSVGSALATDVDAGTDAQYVAYDGEFHSILDDGARLYAEITDADITAGEIVVDILYYAHSTGGELVAS